MAFEKINEEKVSFSIKNYWRMYRARGIRLPIYYFFQSHLFDLLYGTDTHKWLPKNYASVNPENFEHAEMYMASWTCEVIKTYKTLYRMLGPQLKDYVFIDIGCGKGKVGIIWQDCCYKYSIEQKIFGLDILDELVLCAKENHNKFFKSNGNYAVLDATKINPLEFGRKFILYMYNPFDEFILEKVLERFDDFDALVIYNNPVHSDVLLNMGYKKFFEHNGFHPNLHTIGFKK